MGKELSPLAIVLILALFGLLGTPIYLNYNASIELPHLTHMHQAPNGHLFILLGDELYEYDQGLNHYRIIDLNTLGAHSRIGDFAFFSNGDLLIRQGVNNSTLVSNTQRYARMKNTTPDTANNNDQGLMRCQLDNHACSPFGNPPLNLNDTFHLNIDWDTDRVFLTDSSRHALKVYTTDGTLLTKTDTQLKFPNQLLFNDDRLYVANTNRHELSVYTLTDGHLTKDTERSFKTDKTAFTSNNFPASLLVTEEEIWVINYTPSMANGEVIRFSHEGDPIDKLETPQDADLFSMASTDNQVLISDYHNSKIYRYSLQGELLGEFKNGPLFQRIAEYQQARDSHYFWMKFFIGLFVVALLGGMVIGLRQSLAGYSPPPKPSLAEQDFDPHSPDIVWIEVLPKIKRMKSISIGMPIFLILGIGFVIFQINAEVPLKLVLMLASLIPVLTLSFIMFHKLSTQKIGINNDQLILSVGKDKYSAGCGKSIYYSANFIGVNNLTIMLRTNQPIFAENQLVEHLYPLLKQATSISTEQMMWTRFRSNPRMTLLWIASLTFMLAAMFGTEFGWF
ncbi:MAG: hypothetical protein MI754_11500 [Chromatiales bacterium]|nr:hypothetical protein [Chromatiales bacterium]